MPTYKTNIECSVSCSDSSHVAKGLFQGLSLFCHTLLQHISSSTFQSRSLIFPSKSMVGELLVEMDKQQKLINSHIDRGRISSANMMFHPSKVFEV